MDAVEYIKTTARICGTEPTCSDCEIMRVCFAKRKNPEAMVNAVEKWAKEHRPKTRQSEFLKMFPNAILIDGVLIFAPCNVDKTIGGDSCSKTTCEECTRKYWSEEIE